MKSVSEISQELQSLQRHRTWYLRSRIVVQNRLQAAVAIAQGYHNGLPAAEREKAFKQAGDHIRHVCAGEEQSDHEPLILTMSQAADGLDEFRKSYEKEMLKLAKQLPVASWVEDDQQRGFGMTFLAIVIGETGDLSNYSNPGKVWRRMGCAPFTKDGDTLMGSTWKSQNKLHAADWEEFGYCPRRRSIAYLIGEGLMKQNKSVYRERYETKKAEAAAKHPDWIRCGPCKGEGKNKKGNNCSNCKGSGTVMMRCHLHGMLLATKLLLKNLWIEWNKA